MLVMAIYLFSLCNRSTKACFRMFKTLHIQFHYTYRVNPETAKRFLAITAANSCSHPLALRKDTPPPAALLLYLTL
jgi:hypothetical protein